MSVEHISKQLSTQNLSAEPTDKIGQPHSIIYNALASLDKLVPGINDEIKTNIDTLLNEIKSNGVVEIANQPNEVARPTFVLSQATFEHGFIDRIANDPKSVICIIHTDTPTTPLCMINIESTERDLNPLIAPCARGDTGTKLSIGARAPIVHKLCKTCTKDYPYYVCYKQTREIAAESKKYDSDSGKIDAIGEAKEQDKVFNRHYENGEYNIQRHLHNKITPELSGASYLYQEGGTWRYFGISAPQAKDAQDHKDWKVWDVAVDSVQGKELVKKYQHVWPTHVLPRIKS